MDFARFHLEKDVADWLVKDEPAAETPASATKAGESGKTHFVKGIAVHWEDSGGNPFPNPFVATLAFGPNTLKLATDRGVLVVIFPRPINCGEGNAAIISSPAPPATSGASARVYMWGYTL